ncbi:hypothetical protein L1987_15835 [Smallanthus sonchifolius]|uniref:Uncharacterized protein n=1 Tax=Smallanthus sonchifolius TaxID=185202 RepID=A0ACB9J8S6_9ASTR|nr:hypothetical protein L1987_15835 [Smallanthus sonchifolius]
METSETKLNSETKRKVVQIFPHFMARVAKFEELATAGNRFLVDFRQGLEFIRRPSIDKTSEIFEKVIKANNTDRIQSYIKAGYVHTSSRAENLNKLNMSHIQLLNITSQAKNIISELECLVEEGKLAIEAASETSHDYHTDLDLEAATCSEEGNVSFVPEKPRDLDYATMVALVYCMVKQDYVMQEKIVSSLSLKTSSGELESYCLMWSLHPFVNDEVMHQAWSLIS